MALSSFKLQTEAIHAAGPTLRRWYRMHASSAAEPDASANSPINNATPATLVGGSMTVDTSISYQQTGPHLNGNDVNYCWTMNDVRLDRATDWADGDFLASDLGTKGSICFFFKTTQTGRFMRVVGTHPSSTSTQFQFFATYNDGALALVIINGANNRQRVTTSGSPDYRDGAWHFVCWCADGTNEPVLYVDGVAKSFNITTAGTGLTAAAWLSVIKPYGAGTTYRLFNDTRAPGTFDEYFVGSFAELQHWGGALSAAQVFDLWQASQNVPPLVGGRYRRVAGRRLGFTV